MKAKNILLWLLPVAMLMQSVVVIAEPAQAVPVDGSTSIQTSDNLDPAGTAEGGNGAAVDSSPAAQRLASMEQAAAAGDSVLYFDPENGDIALQSRSSGAVWFSSPTGAENLSVADSLKDRLLSQVRVEMYDTQSKLVELYSYKDCVELKQFEVTCIDNGIAVAMTLGQEERRVLLPEALSADSLETHVLSNLEGRALSRVKYFYRKYDPAEIEEDQLAEIAERYPIVREKPIYVLRSVMDAERDELQGYMEEAGYTFEQMEQDILEMGITIEETAKPYVKLTVEYTLDKKGAFWAVIPCDKIAYAKEDFSLSRLYLLEFFAASPREQEGYILVPDGSGAVMRFKQNTADAASTLSLPVYSNDMSLSFNAANVGRAAVRLPAYAIGDENGTLLCSIEQGEAQSIITAGSGGSDNPFAYVGSYLNFADTDSFDFQEVRQQNTMLMVDSHIYSRDYRLRYQPLEKGADYTDVSVAYREYLIEAGKLKKNISSSKFGLTVGLLGAVMHTERFLVFPIDRLIPLTGFEDAQTIAAELLAEDIGALNLRYLGWANGGLENKIYNKARVEGVLGGKRVLAQLVGFCEENGVRLYPDADLVTVARDSFFDGFNPKSAASRMLNKQYSQLQSMDNATNGLNRNNFRYLLNPLAAKKAYASFEKSYAGFGIGMLSLGSAGSMLHSDKNEKNGLNRTQAQEAMTEIFAAASEKFGVMTEGGNAYCFPYVDTIVNIDGEDSGYRQVDFSVPFLQTVLHGYIDYSSAPINLSGDPQTELLKAVENGSSLYYELTYRNGEKLKNTVLYDFYSTDYNTWKDTIVRDYNRVNSVIGDLREDTIADHRYLTDTCVLVTYSSGAKVAVNYGNQPCLVEGQTVAGKDFARIG